MANTDIDQTTLGQGSVQIPSPSRRRFLMLLGAAGGLMALGRFSGRSQAAEASVAGLQAATRASVALGSKVSMTVLHERQEVAQQALDAAFAELESVDQLMSIYRPASQVSILNRDGLLKNPHPCLVEILRKSAEVSQRSHGAFDITVQPLWDVYAAAQKQAGLPDAQAVSLAVSRINWRKVEVSDQQIRLGEKDMAITLNGIAQGYAADRVMASLRQHGIEHALVDTGEIGALGGKSASQPWTVGIQHPRQKDAYVALASLQGRCMATSGDYATSFSADHAYNHIFDPATGRSPQTLASVTIVAPTGADADGLSTAVFVLGPEKGLELIKATAGAEALFVLKDGTVSATDGFPRA